MNYILWALILVLVVTNISTVMMFFDMKRQRDNWYGHSKHFAGKLNERYNKAEARLEQMREDLLDENRF